MVDIPAKIDDLEQRSRSIQTEFDALFTEACKNMLDALTDGGGLEEVYAQCDEMTARLLNSLFNASLPACKASCFECCLLPVKTPEMTIAHVATYLLVEKSDAELNILRHRLRAYTAKLTSVPEEERLNERMPCPFLAQDKTCSIYEVRPLPCRSFNSPDRNLCRANSMADHGRQRTVPQNPMIFRTYQAAATAMQIVEGDEKTLGQPFFIPRLLEMLDAVASQNSESVSLSSSESQ